MLDESFDSNRKFTQELVTQMGKTNMLWQVGGVRARTVDKEMLMFWRANGCRMVSYGIESGSQKILDVMEKNTTVQMNINALKCTHEAGLATIIQLVIGMPGETEHTIKETIDFLKKCMSYCSTTYRDRPSIAISINYARVLPGTPLYEYNRQQGHIGKKLDDEEQYLIQISDIDAGETEHFINSTKFPLLKVLMWRYKILGEVDAHYIQTSLGITFSFAEVLWDLSFRTLRLFLGKRSPKAKNIKAPLDNKLEKYWKLDIKDSTRHFNINLSPARILFLNPISRRWLYPLLVLAVSVKKTDSLLQSFKQAADLLLWSLKHRFQPDPKLPKDSLRKIVVIKPPTIPSEGSKMMIPLRMGR